MNNIDCENMPHEAIDIASDHDYVDYMGMTIGNAYVLGKTTPYVNPDISASAIFVVKSL